MPLLLIPLALVAIVLLWLLLMPVALWQRYRRGHARRLALPWAVGLNAWALALSTLLFIASAWLAGYWIDRALMHAALGLLAGIALGVVGLWLSHFEREPRGLFYAPNRWLALALTLLVAARIGYGLWRGVQVARGGLDHAAWLSQQGSLLAVGGLLLGHYLAYAWGLRSRLPRRA